MRHPFTIRLLPGVKLGRDQGGQITLDSMPGKDAVTNADSEKPHASPAEYVVFLDKKEALGLHPMVLPFRITYFQCDADTVVRLSTFALLRRMGSSLIWETPLAPVRLRCYCTELNGLWPMLAEGTTAQKAAEMLCLPLDGIIRCLELCISASIVSRVEDTGSAVSMWGLHEAFFHSRSRIGRHNNPLGNTYQFKETCDAPPGYRPSASGGKIPLPVPSMADLLTQDVTLTQALERRRSQRQFDHAQPLTLEQLGHFLYRSARITALDRAGGFLPYDVVKHVYPTGGGMGELEIYPVVSQCDGLVKGIYHYDGFEHSLTPLEGAPAHCVTATLNWGATALGEATPPHVMILISARMNRVLWKYSSISYALVLKDVGALMQTFYLVAVSMGLGACAVGTGHSDVFAEMTGAPYWEESLVGEFVVGTLSDSH